MSVAGMTVIDLDSHLVDEMKGWDSFIEERWKPFLPKPLPTEPDERRHTLVGKHIMIGSELTRHFEEKRNWHRPEDLTPMGRVRNHRTSWAGFWKRWSAACLLFAAASWSDFPN